MEKAITWRKPQLVYFNTDELMCKIKIKASSVPCLSPDATSECSQLTTGETWCNTFHPGDDGGADASCGIITQCVEVGPLFGCNDNLSCSTMLPFAK